MHMYAWHHNQALCAAATSLVQNLHMQGDYLESNLAAAALAYQKIKKL